MSLWDSHQIHYLSVRFRCDCQYPKQTLRQCLIPAFIQATRAETPGYPLLVTANRMMPETACLERIQAPVKPLRSGRRGAAFGRSVHALPWSPWSGAVSCPARPPGTTSAMCRLAPLRRASARPLTRGERPPPEVLEAPPGEASRPPSAQRMPAARRRMHGGPLCAGDPCQSCDGSMPPRDGPASARGSRSGRAVRCLSRGWLDAGCAAALTPSGRLLIPRRRDPPFSYPAPRRSMTEGAGRSSPKPSHSLERFSVRSFP